MAIEELSEALECNVLTALVWSAEMAPELAVQIDPKLFSHLSSDQGRASRNRTSA